MRASVFFLVLLSVEALQKSNPAVDTLGMVGGQVSGMVGAPIKSDVKGKLGFFRVTMWWFKVIGICTSVFTAILVLLILKRRWEVYRKQKEAEERAKAVENLPLHQKAWHTLVGTDPAEIPKAIEV